MLYGQPGASSSGIVESNADESEEGLIRRFRNGDRSAFEILWVHNQAKVRRSIAGILANPADVEDVMQDTAIKALLRTHTFQFRCSYSTWLCQIGINTSINILQKRRELPDEEWIASLPASCAFEPEYNVHCRQVLLEISQALELLNFCYRETLTLKLGGLDFDGVAKTTGVGSGTVRSRMARARRRVRCYLEETFDADGVSSLLAF